jgi:hypothetical protein
MSPGVNPAASRAPRAGRQRPRIGACSAAAAWKGSRKRPARRWAGGDGARLRRVTMSIGHPLLAVIATSDIMLGIEPAERDLGARSGRRYTR